MSLGRYINQKIKIVYMDRNNQITERIILIQGINGDQVRAHCFKSNNTRVFKIPNILAYEAARYYA